MWLDYFKHPITQGTIVDGVDWGRGELNPLSIIISNACDLEHGHANFIIVAALEIAKDVLTVTKEFRDQTGGQKVSSRQKNAIIKMLKDYIHNKNVCRHFFFDPRPILDLDCVLVDFQQVKCVEIERFGELDPVAQLKHPFVEQMMMRFTSYTARIPVDRVDQDRENQYLDEIAGEWLNK